MVNPAELRELVATMRELGVVSCCGIVLGPLPTRMQVLEVRASAGDEMARREARREEVLQEYRDKLPNFSDAQLMVLIPPERLDDA